MTSDGQRHGDSVVAVVPARYGSSRLNGKPLLLAAGRPLIVHVLENLSRARSLDRVVVATDDKRVCDAVRLAGGEAMMTSKDHATGTDRIGELLPQLDAEIVVNVQGDEPDLDPAAIDRLVAALRDDPELECGTLAAPWPTDVDLTSMAAVKVVTDRAGRALYFSRAEIPAHAGHGEPASRRLHLGVYAFRRQALLRFFDLPRGPLERSESLEQLRLLENGMTIRVLDVDRAFKGVDTEADYAAFCARLSGRAPQH